MCDTHHAPWFIILRLRYMLHPRHNAYVYYSAPIIPYASSSSTYDLLCFSLLNTNAVPAPVYSRMFKFIGSYMHWRFLWVIFFYIGRKCPTLFEIWKFNSVTRVILVYWYCRRHWRPIACSGVRQQPRPIYTEKKNKKKKIDRLCCLRGRTSRGTHADTDKINIKK
jgi:hypothetical protein